MEGPCRGRGIQWGIYPGGKPKRDTTSGKGGGGMTWGSNLQPSNMYKLDLVTFYFWSPAYHVKITNIAGTYPAVLTTMPAHQFDQYTRLQNKCIIQNAPII